MQVVDRGPRDGAPIVLLHCFTCAIDWWDRMMPMLEREHRVIAIDLLGFGGSEKPGSGYSMVDQADWSAKRSRGSASRTQRRRAFAGRHRRDGTDRESPQLVEHDWWTSTRPRTTTYGGRLPLIGQSSPFTPVIGPALWRVMPDAAVEDGLEVVRAGLRRSRGLYRGLPPPDLLLVRSAAQAETTISTKSRSTAACAAGDPAAGDLRCRGATRLRLAQGACRIRRPSGSQDGADPRRRPFPERGETSANGEPR